MRTVGLSLVLVMMMCSLSFGQNCAGSLTTSCAGSMSARSTPVRNLLQAQPIRTATRSILNKLSRPAAACSGSTTSLSCTGSTQTTSCAGSTAVSSCAGGHVISSVPAPQATSCNCGCEQGLPCSCNSLNISQQTYPQYVVTSSPQKTAVACAACSLAESQKYVSVQQFATPVRTAMSSAYQQALASAQYRADNRIHGHSYLDTHRTSGVGWATSDSNPTTCLGRGGANYAVVRGSDGWYATKFN